MIRFLQTENRFTKAIFIVVIAAASVGMVVYLIPGLAGLGAPSADSYAVVYPHWYSRFFSSGTTVTQARVEQMARQQLQERDPQYADNPAILTFFEQEVGQQLVQQQVLLQVAAKLGIRASDSDVRRYLHSGPTGQVLFPDGQFIGQDAYANLIASRLNETVSEFEQGVKDDIIIQRLEDLVTAPVTVSDQEVREDYLKKNVKIKFDYAVISSTGLSNQINPSDSELEAFFKKNAVRYAQAVPEERKITYFAFTPEQLPGGIPNPTQQQIQAYYSAHQSDYMVPEEVDSRHILIAVAQDADPKTVAAAKAKAEMVLKLLKAGGSWKVLAQKYSDDPGSKNSGGELGFVQRGRMVPEFDNAIFSQKIGQIAIVRSQYGFHVVQVEARKPAHTQPLSQVLPTIQATLASQQLTQAQENYASELTSEAIKNGLEKTAAAHQLQVVTTGFVAQSGMIGALADSSQILAKAFKMKSGDPPQFASTGEGYAIFQVAAIDPAHAPTFAEWKSHVLDDYRSEQLPALLNQKTKELADKANALGNLAKAAKAVGATMETSGLVGTTTQVPDIGDLEQVAPQLFNLPVGAISGPIDTGQNGVVAAIVDKQQPSAQEIAQNLDQTRDQILEQRREQAFNIFVSDVWNSYRKRGLVRMNPKALKPATQGM